MWTRASIDAFSQRNAAPAARAEHDRGRIGTPAKHGQSAAGAADYQEAAAILGVSHQRVDQLVKNHAGFPAPVASLAMGQVFTRASIDEFAKRWERKPGRPRKNTTAGK